MNAENTSIKSEKDKLYIKLYSVSLVSKSCFIVLAISCFYCFGYVGAHWMCLHMYVIMGPFFLLVSRNHVKDHMSQRLPTCITHDDSLHGECIGNPFCYLFGNCMPPVCFALSSIHSNSAKIRCIPLLLGEFWISH